MHIVLYEPEIPPNTGNIMRLCANTGFNLHLIKPLGFSMTEKKLRRAGLDYRDELRVTVHDNWLDCVEQLGLSNVYALSTKGRRNYADVAYKAGDTLVFGPETRGLPGSFLAELPADNVLRIPMLPNNRSLNLSNAAAIVAYEAWRQHAFAGSR